MLASQTIQCAHVTLHERRCRRGCRPASGADGSVALTNRHGGPLAPRGGRSAPAIAAGDNRRVDRFDLPGQRGAIAGAPGGGIRVEFLPSAGADAECGD